jgi:hypothetical protein
VTNRRKPQQRTTKSDWKPARQRSELVKAVGAGVGIVVATALLIFLMKPSDATGTPASNPSVTTPTSSLPVDSSTTLPVDSSTTLPADSTTTTTPQG